MENNCTEKSAKLFERAKKSLSGGLSSDVQKGGWQEYPIYMSHGKGSKVYDVDGNEYIDYLLALGPLIHGYTPNNIIEAVKKQLDKATIFGSPSESLVELAELFIETVPCAEMVSTFSGSGTEANTQAIRLARAYTGKTKLVKFEGCYHGWTDELKVSSEADSADALGPRNNPWKLRHAYGQLYPENTITTPYNDLELLERLFQLKGNDIAAVIIEAVAFNCEPVFPKEGFLQGLRKLCTKYNIVLIFDEVITGFRLALGGAQEYFGVTPDLATFAKAIAGGFPISAVVGRKDIINAGSLNAGTFNGNPVSVAAAIASINELKKPGTYENLNKHSEMLAKGTKKLGEKYGVEMYTESAGGVWAMRFGNSSPLEDYRDHFAKTDKLTYMKVAKACMEKGIRLNPWKGREYVSTAHTEEDIKYTLDVFDKVFEEVLTGEKQR